MDDSHYLKLAIEQARKSVEQGGFPAGAVVVKDGRVIAEGISLGFSLHDPTSHADTAAIRDACRKLETTDLAGATLYESIECCVMCFSVSYWAGISRIVYASKKTPEMVKKFYYEGNINNNILNQNNNRKIKMVFIPDFEQDSLELVKKWEENQKTI